MKTSDNDKKPFDNQAKQEQKRELAQKQAKKPENTYSKKTDHL
ncbi:DUF3941 domain-containing protein [Bacillus fonticola]|nr:DUF3941 domain-containing protein [Bacillus fonticola]